MFAGLIIGAALIAASALLRMRASAWVSLLAAMVAYSETSDALVALATGTAAWGVLRLLRLAARR